MARRLLEHHQRQVPVKLLFLQTRVSIYEIRPKPIKTDENADHRRDEHPDVKALCVKKNIDQCRRASTQKRKRTNQVYCSTNCIAIFHCIPPFFDPNRTMGARLAKQDSSPEFLRCPLARSRHTLLPGIRGVF